MDFSTFRTDTLPLFQDPVQELKLRSAGMLPGLLWATSDTSWRWFQNEGSRGPASVFSFPQAHTSLETAKPYPSMRPRFRLQRSSLSSLSQSIPNHVYHEPLSTPLAPPLLWLLLSSSPPKPLFSLCPFAISAHMPGTLQLRTPLQVHHLP